MVEKIPLGCFGNKTKECKKYFLDTIKNADSETGQAETIFFSVNMN